MFHLIYGDYNLKNKDFDKINRPNGSGDFLFLYFLTPMKVKLGNEIVITRENAFILYTPDYPQYYQAVRKFENSYIHFQTSIEIFSELEIPQNQVFYINNHTRMNDLIKGICTEYVAKECFSDKMIDTLITQLFINISRQLMQTNINENVDYTLFNLFHDIRHKILMSSDQQWSSETMAKLTNLSVSQFYYYYKLFFHAAPKSELIEARIERAKYLLLNKSIQINEIADIVGFQNIYHFTRYFKKLTGFSPKNYRNKYSDFPNKVI